MQELIARFVSRRPGVALGIVAAFVIASIAAIAARGVRYDFTPQALFSGFPDQAEIDARFKAQFGSTENVVFVLVSADDVLATPVVQYVHTLTTDIRDNPYARRVESMTVSSLPRNVAEGELRVDAVVSGPDVDDAEAAQLRQVLSAPSLLRGTLISESGRLAVIAVFLADGYERLALLSEAMRDLEGTLARVPPPDGARVELGGLPKIRVYMIDCFRRDQARLIPISMGICCVVLAWCFMWIPGMLLPMAAVAISALVTVGAMALFGEPFNIINQVVPTLIIVIGVSDSIHLVARFGEELRHRPPDEASFRTVATMAAACFLTSFTTAVGFGSLAVSRTEVLARFGVTAAVGVMIAYGVTIFFLPPALRRVRPPRHGLESDAGWMGRLTEACVVFSMRHAKAVLAVSAVLSIGFGAWGSTVVIDTHLLETFPEDDPIAEQTRRIEQELNGVLPIEISLETTVDGRFDDAELLNAVVALQADLEQEPIILETRSYTDILHHAWAAYAGDPAKLDAPFRSRQQVAQLAALLEGGRPDPITPYVDAGRTHLRVTLHIRDVGSRATLAMTERARARIEEHLGAFDDVSVSLSGDAYTGALGLDALIRDMASSLAMAVVVIFTFMSVLFRSARMGLISMPANVIPLIGAGAYMAARGFPLNTTTVIIFSVALGLAVDDTIHMMSRYREERLAGHAPDVAMRLSGRHSGKGVIVTSVMLCAGMSVMLVSSFNPVRLFGEIIATTLAVCLFADLIVLPATLKVFGGPQGGVRAPVRGTETAGAPS